MKDAIVEVIIPTMIALVLWEVLLGIFWITYIGYIPETI